jgi:hypothetical protein
MNYVALVTHGLSAMSVFGERIGVRLIVATLGSVSALLVIVASMFLYSAIGGGAVPHWMLYALAFLVLVFLQALSASLSFVFIILGGRDSSTFLPSRDYSHFRRGRDGLACGLAWHRSLTAAMSLTSSATRSTGSNTSAS